MKKYKKCPKCKRKLELNSTHFYKDKNTKNGFKCYCIECSRILRRENYLKDPLKSTEYNFKRLYGISYKDYKKMEKKQNHRCGICGMKLEQTNPNNQYNNNKHFSVDHNHKTGKIRGLLCRNCNSGIGWMRENPYILIKTIKYLKSNK